ncbi:MAG: hypothetical protein IPM56_03475 [Ignavibacteriales bacterium]|nr:MAG: hypothetical protein IPM56_03475 [Ignavibacteriales bacterium]
MNKKLHILYVGSFFLVGILVTVLLIINGYTYYNTSLEERFFHPQNAALKPSGALGHGLGIIGTLMMIVGVSVYMLRKRVRKFFGLGYLKHWLEFHIFLCSVGPVLVLFHTAFKFGGIVSVSFWSMVAVVLSGVAGRFIYIQIPRSIQGQELSVKELSNMSDELSFRLKREFSINGRIAEKLEKAFTINDHANLSLLGSILLVIKEYFSMRSVLKDVKNDLKLLNISHHKEKQILAITKSKLNLMRRIGMLKSMQKLFKYWHIAHLPFAISMFVIMIIHVGVTIAFGYKWIF